MKLTLVLVSHGVIEPGVHGNMRADTSMRGTVRSTSGPIARGLTINFTNTPNMGGRMLHWQYDTFIALLFTPGS